MKRNPVWKIMEIKLNHAQFTALHNWCIKAMTEYVTPFYVQTGPIILDSVAIYAPNVNHYCVPMPNSGSDLCQYCGKPV